MLMVDCSPRCPPQGSSWACCIMVILHWRGIVRVWRLGTAAGHNVHLSWGCGNGGVSASRCVFLSSEVPIVTEELSVGCENSHG
ncbi:hypothetical protein SKAU_G00025610 [Synaphobranchus kaupii]|uniref:Uncharacterized protein n=1 Tax=Synaphobranchus kaupii TaxID=118154 RepID=A0A9Q1GDV3_SYNKA|nr:hypothetical protein SKAU_G00025610 [Synaphobranchus kaupii]